MRNTALICVIAFILLGCQKDDPVPIIDAENELHYDANNLSAPVLARGISYPTVIFPGGEIGQQGFTGGTLEAVKFFVEQQPSDINLLIFEFNPADPNEPGDLLYEDADVNTSSNSWNVHHLNPSFTLPEHGIWIAFEIDTGDNDVAVIGCDPGPRATNGDVYGFFGDNNPGWTTFYDFSFQATDINWNIRAVIE